MFVLGSSITSQQPLVLGCVERYPLLLGVCVCVCVSITPDYPWFINYNSLSSIQFLSLATQNTVFAIYFPLDR